MKKISFGESITILIIMLIILGTAVIHFGLSPQIPVLFTIALLVFWAKFRGLPGTTSTRGFRTGSAQPSFRSLSSS